MTLVNLANFKPVKKPMKKGTLPTWSTFLTRLVGLEDSTAPYEFGKERAAWDGTSHSRRLGKNE